MKLAFLTNAYTDGTWIQEDAIRRIAEAGYTGVAILADKPLLWLPEANLNDVVRSYRQVLDATGLYLTNVNGFTAQGYLGRDLGAPGSHFGPIFTDVDEESRQIKIAYTKRVIDLAAELGDDSVNARNVSIGTGYPPKDIPADIVWRYVVEAIKPCAAYAHERGVSLNLEPEPGMPGGTSRECLQMISDVDCPAFGVNFDIGHLYAIGEDVSESALRLAPWIRGVDIDDIVASDVNRFDPDSGLPLHDHQVPGDGDMPLPRILRTLQVLVMYRGYYTVELYNHSHHAEEVTDLSIERLRPIFAEVGRGA